MQKDFSQAQKYLLSLIPKGDYVFPGEIGLKRMQALLEEDQRQLTELASQNAVITNDLKKRLKTVRRSISNVTEAIAERKKSKALLAKLTSLENDETELLSALSGAERSRSAHAPRPFTSEEIAFLSTRLVASLHSADNTTLRAILHAVVNSLTIDRTANRAFGTLKIHTPREPETPEDDPPLPAGEGRVRESVIITASSLPPPVGAPLHTRSIPFEFPVTRKSHAH